MAARVMGIVCDYFDATNGRWRQLLGAADFLSWLAQSGVAGPQGPAGALTLGATNARSVALGAATQATDPTQPAFVSVNLSSTAALTISGGTTNSAVLETSPDGSTWSQVGSYSNALTGTLVVGVSIQNASIQQYTAIVPAQGYFRIRQTAGTVTIVSAFDQAI